MKYYVAMVDHPIRDSFFTSEVVEEMKRYGEVFFSSMTKPDPDTLKREIRDADVVFTGWGSPMITEDILAHAAQLKFHAHTGGSVANYVSGAEYERGIRVLSGNDLYAQSVAEGCLCLTLNALRRTHTYVQTIKSGGYLPEKHYNQGLIGKKVALIGYGAVAGYYARLLRQLRVKLFVVSEHISETECEQIQAKPISIESAFSSCDVISLHMALTDKTRGRIGEELLGRIRPGALLVNTARADIVDQEALYRQLQTGRFQAALDVFHAEPLPEDDPLRFMPNVLLMPHVAGPTLDLRGEIVLQLLKDIELLKSGGECKNLISFAQAKRMTFT